MAKDYTSVRSMRNPSMSSYGSKVKGSSKMGGGGYGYGQKSDRYAGMPTMKKGEKEVLKDGTQSSYVYPLETDTEKYDLGRMRYDNIGMKGYARQAFEYDY